MRRKKLLLLAGLLLLLLSCYSSDKVHVIIHSVTVTPPNGSGFFTLEVTYSTPGEVEPVSIECDYRRFEPQRSESRVAGIIDVPQGQALAFQTQQFTLQATEPGNYVASCMVYQSVPPVDGYFTVVEAQAAPNLPPDAPTPTPSLTPAPAPTLTPAPSATHSPSPTPAAPIVGRILMDYGKAQSGRAGAGGELSYVTNPCIPQVSLQPDGSLHGECERLNIQDRLVNESFTALVSGQVDAAGSVSFTYEVTEIGNPNGTWRVSYSGSGQALPGAPMSGTAQFAYSCSSGQENLLWCGSQTSEEFTGSIPWSFQPLP